MGDYLINKVIISYNTYDKEMGEDYYMRPGIISKDWRTNYRSVFKKNINIDYYIEIELNKKIFSFEQYKEFDYNHLDEECPQVYFNQSSLFIKYFEKPTQELIELIKLFEASIVFIKNVLRKKIEEDLSDEEIQHELKILNTLIEFITQTNNLLNYRDEKLKRIEDRLKKYDL